MDNLDHVGLDDITGITTKPLTEQEKEQLLTLAKQQHAGPHQFRALPPIPPTTVDVLREHVAFLREMLAERQTWQLARLGDLQQRSQNQEAAIDRLRQDREQLRLALAVAVNEIESHNGEGDNPHRTDSRYLEDWYGLLEP